MIFKILLSILTSWCTAQVTTQPVRYFALPEIQIGGHSVQGVSFAALSSIGSTSIILGYRSPSREIREPEIQNSEVFTLDPLSGKVLKAFIVPGQATDVQLISTNNRVYLACRFIRPISEGVSSPEILVLDYRTAKQLYTILDASPSWRLLLLGGEPTLLYEAEQDQPELRFLNLRLGKETGLPLNLDGNRGVARIIGTTRVECQNQDGFFEISGVNLLAKKEIFRTQLQGFWNHDGQFLAPDLVSLFGSPQALLYTTTFNADDSPVRSFKELAFIDLLNGARVDVPVGDKASHILAVTDGIVPKIVLKRAAKGRIWLETLEIPSGKVVSKVALDDTQLFMGRVVPIAEVGGASLALTEIDGHRKIVDLATGRQITALSPGLSYLEETMIKSDPETPLRYQGAGYQAAWIVDQSVRGGPSTFRIAYLYTRDKDYEVATSAPIFWSERIGLSLIGWHLTEQGVEAVLQSRPGGDITPENYYNQFWSVPLPLKAH